MEGTTAIKKANITHLSACGMPVAELFDRFVSAHGTTATVELSRFDREGLARVLLLPRLALRFQRR